jgi:hypothetical protein
MRRGTGAIGAGEVLEDRGTQKTGTRVVTTTTGTVETDPRITDGTGLRRHGGKNIISASWLTTETCVTQESQTGLACGDTVGKI